MRIAPSLVLLVALVASTSIARADTGLAFDFGYVRSRVAVTDQTTIGGNVGRFALRYSTGRYLHFGAEAEEGWIAGDSALPNGAVARTSGETENPDVRGPLEGNTLSLKVFGGAHTNIGKFTVGADLATGIRDTWVSSDLGPDVAGRKNERLLEARSRVDVGLTPSTTIGVVASTDLIERRDISIGAVFALKFTR